MFVMVTISGRVEPCNSKCIRVEGIHQTYINKPLELNASTQYYLLYSIDLSYSTCYSIKTLDIPIDTNSALPLTTYLILYSEEVDFVQGPLKKNKRYI
jgi:hypothetical protein